MKKVLSAIMFALAIVVALVLPAPASAGSAWWVANGDSNITGPQNAVLVGDNTSVETTEAFDGVEVVVGLVIFQYQLMNGAKCTAGAPRVFATVGGITVNSWDQNLEAGAQCGSEPDEDGWREVTMKVPSGKVTALGLVYDNGAGGEVRVQALGLPIDEGKWGMANFESGEPDPEPEPTKSATESPKPTTEPTAKPTTEPTVKPTTPTPTTTESSLPADTPSPSDSTSTVGTGTDSGNDSGSGGLPLTGSKVLVTGGAGVLLMVFGGLLLVWARRRAEGQGDTIGRHRNDGDTQILPVI